MRRSSSPSVSSSLSLTKLPLSSPHRYAAQLESVGLVITLLFAFEMFLKLLGLG